MADFGNVETMLAGVADAELRRVFKSIFQYVLKDVRLGRAVADESSKNFGGGFFTATTPSVANTEFSIVHSFGRTPYLLIPVLPLDAVGAKLVRLSVSKAADTAKIYLKSPDTDSDVFVYLEG